MPPPELFAKTLTRLLLIRLPHFPNTYREQNTASVYILVFGKDKTKGALGAFEKEM